MEMWDCYTWDRQKLDHQHPRGVPLAQGEYHLVVEIWTVNRRGEILLTQRHPDKPYGCVGNERRIGSGWGNKPGRRQP